MSLNQMIIGIVVIIFVIMLILFPEFRALLKGFTKVFIKDMATTPEGAEAIYGEKIDQAQEAYNKADNALKVAAGKLSTAKRDMENLKSKLSKVESECESLVKNGKIELAQLKAEEREEILADIKRYSELVKAYEAAENTAREAQVMCEKNLRKLKRESKEVVENMRVKKQLKEVYDDMDELKNVTATDKLLESVRDKNKDLDAVVEGSKVVHESKTSTKLQKADAEAKKFAGLKTGLVKTNSRADQKVEVSSSDTDNKVSVSTENDTTDANNKSDNTNVINLSLDEWVGYATILQANGGLTTQPGSIYDKLGIKVNINIINDATQSSNALIKGELDGAGYTINRLAFLSSKFSNAKIDVVMPYITNYSNGGDGIIALSSINTIEDLVDARIGVPQFSESQAMIVWFVNQSNLSQEDKDKIISNLILFETPDEAAKAFFAGKIDVAGTWQPYLTQAENMTNSHILFSTANSTKLIMALFSGMISQKLIQNWLVSLLMVHYRLLILTIRN